MILQKALCRSSDGSAGSEYELEALLQEVDALHQHAPAPSLPLPPCHPTLALPPMHDQATQQLNMRRCDSAAPGPGCGSPLDQLRAVPNCMDSIAGSMGSLQPTFSGGTDGNACKDADFDEDGSGSDDGDSCHAGSGSAGTAAQMPAMRMRTRGADKPRPPPPPPVGKRKLGRPIMFTGDLDDPNLTKDERRRIRRRAANRASAQRVRERRMQQASLVLTQLNETEARRDVLQATLVKTQGEVQHLAMALQQASQGWVAESAKGSRLRSQLASVSSPSMPDLSLGQPASPARQHMELQQPVQPMQLSMPAAGMFAADAAVPGFW